MVFSFALPAVLWCGAALRGLPNPAAATARALAAAFRAEGVTGPFAGSGSLPGGRTGLYTAFLLGGRWLGDDPREGPEEFARAGARVVFVRAGTGQFERFARAAGWSEKFPGESGQVRVFLQEILH